MAAAAPIKFPSDLGYGFITGRLVIDIGDTNDVGDEPDLIALSGARARIEANQALKTYMGEAGKMLLLKSPKNAIVDAEGYLCRLFDGDVPGPRMIPVISADEEKVSAKGLAYTVTFTDTKGAAKIPPITIPVGKGKTEDIADWIDAQVQTGAVALPMTEQVRRAIDEAVAKMAVTLPEDVVTARDLEGYADTQYVDAAIAALEIPDLSGVASADEVKSLATTVGAKADKSALDTLAAAIPDMTQLATKSDLEKKADASALASKANAATVTAGFAERYTKAETDQAINAVKISTDGLATKQQIDQAIAKNNLGLAEGDRTVALKSEVVGGQIVLTMTTAYGREVVETLPIPVPKATVRALWRLNWDHMDGQGSGAWLSREGGLVTLRMDNPNFDSGLVFITPPAGFRPAAPATGDPALLLASITGRKQAADATITTPSVITEDQVIGGARWYRASSAVPWSLAADIDVAFINKKTDGSQSRTEFKTATFQWVTNDATLSDPASWVGRGGGKITPVTLGGGA